MFSIYVACTMPRKGLPLYQGISNLRHFHHLFSVKTIHVVYLLDTNSYLTLSISRSLMTPHDESGVIMNQVFGVRKVRNLNSYAKSV